MKKITLILSLLGVLIIVNAQTEKSKILEKLRLELLPQTEDYNPYQYAREEHILSILEFRKEIEREDCENVKELIEMFNNNITDGIYRDEIDYIRHISRFQCKEAYDFLKTQILNNPSEITRYYSIMFLAWSLEPAHLSLIFEYAKRDSLSVKDNLALGSAFMIYGVYTSNSELKAKAIRLLDAVCYDFSSDTIPGFDSTMDILRSGCDACYFKLGGKAAIKYYTSLLGQREGFRKVAIASTIAELGEYESTFPIFVEAIHRGTANDILCALDGLKVIGSVEALRLIEEHTHSKNEKISKKAQEILKNIDKKRREE